MARGGVTCVRDEVRPNITAPSGGLPATTCALDQLIASASNGRGNRSSVPAGCRSQPTCLEESRAGSAKLANKQHN